VGVRGAPGGQKPALALGFTGEGQTLFAAGGGGVRFWAAEDGKEREAVAGLREPLTAASLGRDGRMLAVAGKDRRVRLWDVAAGRAAGEPFGPLPLEVPCLALSDDSRTVALGQGAVVQLWDVDSGQERAGLARHTQAVTAVAFVNNSVLASGSGDGREVWFVRSGELILWDAAPVPVRGGEVHAVEPDDTTASARAVVAGPAHLAHTCLLLPWDRRGRVAGDPARQAERLLDNLDVVLAEVRSGFDGLARLNVCVARDDLADVFTKTMALRFSKRARPAVSFVTTRLAHPDALFGLDAVAVTPVRSDAGVPLRTVAGLPAPAGGAHVAVLPYGGRVYVSAQAEPGDLPTATRKTLTALAQTLFRLQLAPRHVVQVKAFLAPAADPAIVEREVEAFFGKGSVPPLVLAGQEATAGGPAPAGRPVAIELIAALDRANPNAPDVEYLNRGGRDASPLDCRAVRVQRGPTIYVSGQYAGRSRAGGSPAGVKAEAEEVFGSLRPLLAKAGSDPGHLVKGTYYVATEEAGRALDEARAKFYDPTRPPAGSKVTVAGVARAGRSLMVDLVAVPVQGRK
jgi:enamine deaminase RidA (YjgF/YER057c/UK114 family)